MPTNTIKDDLIRALNVVKDVDPGATAAIKHILKHGERYYLLMDEDELPEVLKLARNIALRAGVDRNEGVSRMCPMAQAAILARATLRLASLVDTLTAQIQTMQVMLETAESKASARD